MSAADILLTLVIVAALALAVRRLARSAKNGKTCGCGCASCPKQCGKRKE